MKGQCPFKLPLINDFAGKQAQMKRILLLILVIGILLLSACGAPTTAPSAEAPTAPVFTGGPRISFDEDFIYLGEATPDQKINYEFRFQNIGDAQLIVYGTTQKALEGC